MKKMQNVAVVLAAAALLALGATSAFAAGWVQNGGDWYYQENSGDYATDTMKKSGDVTFYLGEDGRMVKDQYVEYGSGTTQYYYFGSNGAMVKNTWVALDADVVGNGDDLSDMFWFYFGDNGKAYKGTETNVSKKTIDGKDYFFDQYGHMMTGWFNKEGEKYDVESEDNWYTDSSVTKYYAGEDGVARGGWLAWTDGLVDGNETIGHSDVDDRDVMYFYFDPGTYKLKTDTRINLNGKFYRFNDKGLMYTEWEYMEDKYDGTPYDDDDKATIAMAQYNLYFSGEEDGHQVKKGWVYAVPSTLIDSSDNEDDEEEYFYFGQNGQMTMDKRQRINGKYYAFNKVGIMETGLVILQNGKFIGTIDSEYTEFEDLVKRDVMKDEDHSTPQGITGADKLLPLSQDQKLHYFGEDGAVVTGNKVMVDLADGTFQFSSDNNGGFQGEKKKKYYSNGFLLKGSEDIRYAIVALNKDDIRKENWKPSELSCQFTTNKATYSETRWNGDENDIRTATGSYIVVSSTGSKVKKGAKKDANGDTWLISQWGQFLGVYNCDVKYKTNEGLCWKAEYIDTKTGDSKEADVRFAMGLTADTKDATKARNNKTPGYITNGDNVNKHLVTLTNDYCANFTLKDEN